MSVEYTRINWEDSPSTQTPLNAENLNAMDSAIDELTGAVNELDGVTDDIEELQTDVGAIKNDLSEFPNGNYPQMGAGYANQLVSGLKKEDSTPYNFRRIPYDATLEDVEKIVGGTIVNNQLVTANGANLYTMAAQKSATGDELTVTSNADTVTVKGATIGSDYVQSGHVYFGRAYAKSDGTTGAAFAFRRGGASISAGYTLVGWNETTTYVLFERIAKCTYGDEQCGVFVKNESAMGAYGVFKDIQTVDLTQDFGTSIADYVYSLEQATAGAGVAWLKKHFPAQFDAGYQAYDAGSLQSVSGLTMHKMVGFNQWDEEWEEGSLNSSNGEKTALSGRIRTKNYVPILPNTTYYVSVGNGYGSNALGTLCYYDANKNFLSTVYPYANAQISTPNNAYYMMVGFYSSYGDTYKNDICINFHWDGEKDGTYEPYKTWSYALDDSVTLRGIPKVDAQGYLYYDGDEYLPDGTVNRRYGIVDLGTLNWQWQADGCFYADIPNKTQVSENVNLVCGKYTAYTQNASGISIFEYITDKTITGIKRTTPSTNSWVYVKDTSYTDATAFKESLSGVYLVYELATPTTETADPYTTPQIIAPDGTEEYIYEDGAFELPVGHSSEYPVDVSGQLDDILDTPSANGTYTLKATVTDGAVSYSWVADA